MWVWETGSQMALEFQAWLIEWMVSLINWDRKHRRDEMSGSILDSLRLSALDILVDMSLKQLAIHFGGVGKRWGLEIKCWHCVCASWNPKTQEEHGWEEQWAENRTPGKPTERHWDVAGEDTDSAGQLTVHRCSLRESESSGCKWVNVILSKGFFSSAIQSLKINQIQKFFANCKEIGRSLHSHLRFIEMY